MGFTLKFFAPVGDRVFHGRIDSFAPGTGAQFALLPPENATGNFTKIVQRVPVKIILDDEAAARASLQRSEINLEQAKLNLEYTTISAPIDGVVGDRALRKGQLVQPGSNLLILVPMGNAIYLVANFKETQVGAMDEGQAVTFTVDAFGYHCANLAGLREVVDKNDVFAW